jgi:hypothetical protein
VPGGLKALLKHHILPADAESYERMVEQIAGEIAEVSLCKWSMLLAAEKQDFLRDARAALRAIGITQLKKGKK